MVAVRPAHGTALLWLTADHPVLAKQRPRNLGGTGGWSAIPAGHFGRARDLRRNQTPAEQQLWPWLRREQLGCKFRRQHPLGPYIADFYSRDVSLVVELDGASHTSAAAQAYDHRRNRYMQSLGLTVLRFPNNAVYQHVDGVLETIRQHIRGDSILVHQAAWMQAADLRQGDLMFGVERIAVRLAAAETHSVVQEAVHALRIAGPSMSR